MDGTLRKFRVKPIKAKWINGGNMVWRVYHPDGWLWRESSTLDRALWHAREYAKYLAHSPDALPYRDLLRSH